MYYLNLTIWVSKLGNVCSPNSAHQTILVFQYLLEELTGSLSRAQVSWRWQFTRTPRFPKNTSPKPRPASVFYCCRLILQKKNCRRNFCRLLSTIGALANSEVANLLIGALMCQLCSALCVFHPQQRWAKVFPYWNAIHCPLNSTLFRVSNFSGLVSEALFPFMVASFT